jgi:hypothetical protein
MTIEFHCPYCQKLLKTADDKAGVRANCPGCGQAVTVPDLAHEAAQADHSPGHDQSAVAAPATPDATAAVSEDDGGGTAVSAPTKICPMCGETILQAATRCRYCGENLVAVRPEGAPTQVEAGEMLSQTWGLYKSHLGLLVGSIVIVGAISGAVAIAGSVLQQVLALAMIGPQGGRPGNNQAGAAIAILGMTLISTTINLAVSAYLQAGLHVLLLRIARRENAEFSDLFAGGRFFWRFFWGSLLFQIMIGVGLLLLIIPGIILALMFWPYLYIMVDRDKGVIDSLSFAREVTTGNHLVVLVLFLAGLGITLLGIFPGCGIGLLFTVPFAELLWAVTYCGISGQLARERQ